MLTSFLPPAPPDCQTPDHWRNPLDAVSWTSGVVLALGTPDLTNQVIVPIGWRGQRRICAGCDRAGDYTFDIQGTDMTRPGGTIVLTAALVACAGALQRPAWLQAQETRATFRTAVALLPISAVVRDSHNRIVRDLAVKDFHLLENSQPL